MARTRKPPTVWQARWYRWHRRVVALLLVIAVGSGVFVSLGLAALFVLAALGIATFTTGAPTENGPQSPPSVPGTYYSGSAGP